MEIPFAQLPQALAANIRQDSEEPRAKAIMIAKFLQLQKGGEECLLDRVLRIGAAKQPPSKSEGGNAIALDKLAKCQLISGQHPLDYRSVVLGNHPLSTNSGTDAEKGYDLTTLD